MIEMPSQCRRTSPPSESLPAAGQSVRDMPCESREIQFQCNRDAAGIQVAESRARAARKQKPSADTIVLRSGLSIGAAAAEDDLALLLDCFEDSGAYQEIRDIHSPKFLVKGRTGAGKSALLIKLQNEATNVIRIDPGHLCLQHISNSDILQFLALNDVRIDPFFEIIWKHTFATELLRRKYRITNEEQSRSTLYNLLSSVHPSRRRAVEYLRDFGLHLWPEFEERVTAVTRKIEDDIRAELGLDLLGVQLDGGRGRTATSEQKAEIQRRIHKVLGANQLSKLQTVIEFMANEVFRDQKAPYYIVIDDLDQFHVDDAVRLRLLRALIDIVKKFRPIACVKFCVAMRSDLIEEIFEKTRDRGFQEEKYEDCIITLRWSRDQLFKLIERRIREQFKRRYTRDNVGFHDVFPQSVQSVPTKDYVLDRTLMRPRDAILFVNECLDRAVNQTRVTPTVVRDAEVSFSQKRLNSLRDEWRSMHPLVEQYVVPLRGMPAHFTPADIDQETMRELALSVATTVHSDTDRLGSVALNMVGGATEFDAWGFEKAWLGHLYKIGVVGIKLAPQAPISWSYQDKQEINSAELSPDCRVEVHPMLRRCLGTVGASERANALRKATVS